MRSSVRHALLVWLVPTFIVLLGLGALAAYRISQRPALEAYDQALTDDAIALSLSIRMLDDHPALDLSPQSEKLLRTDPYDRIYFAVRAPDGVRIAGEALPPPRSGAHEGRILYDDSFRGNRVRVVALDAPCGDRTCFVQVAETTIKRDRLRREIVLDVLLPAAGLAGVTLLLVWFAVGRSLRPLTRLSREVATRSHRDLSPIDEADAPAEARGLVAAINRLLADLDAAAAAQRRFLADAAHQLRTPLAGIQTQAELAREQSNPAELRKALAHVHDAALRTARLANQLLVLARAEPGVHRFDDAATCDLLHVIESNADDWVRRAVAKDIDLGFEVHPAIIRGDPLLMTKLIANLVDNAIEYTPREGYATLRCSDEAGWVRLEVEDNGPGIRPEERARVLERFYRVPGTPGPGSGLGLAIVNEIAQLYGAVVEIAAPPQGRGTLVIVRMPASVCDAAHRRVAKLSAEPGMPYRPGSLG